jgi:methylated-DNA-[protein]-cysteine S-methyltransferase
MSNRSGEEGLVCGARECSVSSGPGNSATPRATYDAVIAAPFGRIGIRIGGACVTNVAYLPAGAPLQAPANALAREICAEIRAYLANPEHRFGIPYLLHGSAFEQRVWRAIAAIPSGTTRTYGELARTLDTAARPVGRACGSNPVPLIVPCHRVVAAGGGIGGFMHSRTDASLAIKHWLLRHEGSR